MLFNRIKKLESGVVPETASFQVTSQKHANKFTKLDKATGLTATLPAATGSGDIYSFVVGTAVTSNTYVINASTNGADFVGIALGVDTDAEGATGYTWNADASDNTFTMTGASTGGKIGDIVEVVDIAPNLYLIQGRITQSGGSEATPFSAA